MQLSTFLRRVLMLDAASCLAMGLVLVLGGSELVHLSGIDAAIVRGAGLGLLPVGLFMLWLGSRQYAWAGFVYLVIAGNLLWTVESLVLVFTTRGITPLGAAFVLGQAGAVAVLTVLEWMGARSSRAAAAA